MTERLWIPAASNHYTPGREGTVIDTIIFHSTVASWAGTIATFTGGSRLVSAHYVVDQYVDRIAQMVDEEDTSWANGNWAMNLRSITIERVDNGDHAAVGPDEQYDRLIALVAEIKSRHAIRYYRRHSEIVATACPSGLDTERIIHGGEEVPTQEEWDGVTNSIIAIKEVLEHLAHAKHPEHVLSPKAKAAMRNLDKRVAKMQSRPVRKKAPSKAAARAGHGRGR
jgi:hypothetical protein